MTSRILRRLFVALLGASLAGSAMAADLKAEAKEHYVAGLEAVQRGALALAIGEFMASWDLYKHPATARNIARAYEDHGDLQRALVWYQRVQDLVPAEAAEVAVDILRVREAMDPVVAPTAVAAAPTAAPVAASEPVASARVEPVRVEAEKASLEGEFERIRAAIEAGRRDR